METNPNLKSFHLSHKLSKLVLRFGKNEPICISHIIEFPKIYHERLGDFSFQWLQHLLLAQNLYYILLREPRIYVPGMTTPH